MSVRGIVRRVAIALAVTTTLTFAAVGTASAQTCQWTAAQGNTQWYVAGNWSCLPVNGDDVNLNFGGVSGPVFGHASDPPSPALTLGTLTVTEAGFQVLDGILVIGNISHNRPAGSSSLLAGGILQVNTDLFLATDNTLTMNGGTLDMVNGSTITGGGLVDWNAGEFGVDEHDFTINGPNIDASGLSAHTLPADSNITLESGSLIFDNLVIPSDTTLIVRGELVPNEGATISGGGTVVIDGGALSDDTTSFDISGVTVSATNDISLYDHDVTLGFGGILQIESSSDVYSAAGASLHILNGGQLTTAIAGATVSAIDVPVENDGAVVSYANTLRLPQVGAGSDSGSFITYNDATIEFLHTGQTRTLDDSLIFRSGTGYVYLSDGDLEITNGLDVQGEFRLNGGNFDTDSAIVSNGIGEFVWRGGTISGSASYTFGGSIEFVVDTVGSPHSLTAPMTFGASTRVEMLAGTQLDGFAINNQGEFYVGAVGGAPVVVNSMFHNTGVVEVLNSQILALNSLSASTFNSITQTLLSGTWDMESGGQVHIGDDIHNVSATVRIVGSASGFIDNGDGLDALDGALSEVSSIGSLTLDGHAIAFAGAPTTISGGLYLAGSGTWVAFDGLEIPAGTTTIGADANVSGDVDVVGGTLSGSGTILGQLDLLNGSIDLNVLGDPLTVDGYTQQDLTTLSIEVDSATQAASLVSTGNMDLHGDLDIDTSGYAIDYDDYIVILSAINLTGTFSNPASQSFDLPGAAYFVMNSLAVNELGLSTKELTPPEASGVPTVTDDHDENANADPTIDIEWTATDDPDSGLDGYAISWDNEPLTAISQTKVLEEDATTTTSPTLTSGTWYVHMRAVDNEGNWNSTVHAGPFVIDVTPATTSLDVSPTALSNDNDPGLEFSSELGATFECKLDDAVFEDCTSPLAYTDLADGEHTFQVRAYDSVGNMDQTPASHTWTVDATPPDTTIDSGPAEGSTSISTTATFGFSGGATFECKLDDGAFADCTSTKEYTTLTEGAHTFNVRGTDSAGNVDASPATRTFTVDSTGPTINFITQPSGTVYLPTATVSFASENNATFMCSLDSAVAALCTSPVQLSGLTLGVHTFSVYAVDVWGNSGSSITANWTYTQGTAGRDVIVGSTGNDVFNTVAGNDVVNSGGGNDTVNGGTGADIINGGAGNDIIYGGPGNDTLTGGKGKDIIKGQGGNDTINANDRAGGDIVDCGTGRDKVIANKKDKVKANCEKVTRR